MDPAAAPLPSPRRWRFRRLAVLLAAPVVAALALLLCAPLWIDTPQVRVRVAALADGLSGGRAHWNALELHYLPRPAATLRQVSLELPPRIAAQADAVTVELEWLALLRGAVQPARLVVTSPRVRVQLPPADPAAPGLTVAHARAAAQRALEAAFAHAPAVTVALNGGELEVLTATGTPFRFTGVSVDGRMAAGTLEASASLSSPLFESLALELRLQREGLQGAGSVRITGMRVAEFAALVPGLAVRLDPAQASAALEWQLAGADDLSATLRAAAPALTARRGAGQIALAGLAFEAQARLRGETFVLEVPHAAAARPALEARGQLSRAPDAGWRASLDVTQADAGELQALAEGLLPGVAALARPAVRLEAGSLLTASLAAAGATLPALADPRSLRAEARLDHGALRIAAAEAHVHHVRAHASLADGRLRVDGLAARSDAAEVTDGAFAIGVGARPVTLEGSVSGRLDLAGTVTLARRLLKAPGKASQALGRVRELRGGARFTVALRGEARRPRARVEVSAINATARVEGLPLPVALTGGTATLEESRLHMRGLSGSVGRSRLRDGGARITLGRKAWLESASGNAVIDLKEALALARDQPALAGKLQQVRDASGELAVQLDSATGPLGDPRALRYALGATPRGATVTLAPLGAPLSLDGGRMTLTPGAVAAADMAMGLRDATLRAGGRMPLPGGPGAGLEISASGSLGPAMLEWIHSRARLPEGARLTEALAVQSFALQWRGADAFEVRGGLRPGTGPEIAFHARRAGKRVELRSLALRDAHSDCTLGGSLEGSRFEFRFDGHLAGRSLAALLRRPALADALLRGRFEASGDWTDPAGTRAEGTLDVSRMPLPTPLAQAVVVERARVEVAGERLRIPAAVVRLGTARVDVEASIARTARKFVLDASIRGDEVDLRRPPGTGATPAEPPAGPPGSAWERLFATLDRVPVSGRVRVDFARVLAGKLEVAPLEAGASLEDGRLDVNIARGALCGISVAGSLWARRGLAGARGTLSARGAALDATLPCLTNGRLRFAGKLDLDGTFSAQGAPGSVVDSLAGTFRAVSREGRIDRFEALARLLLLLNLTEVVRGQVPELGTAGMTYRSASVTGRIQGRVVHMDEGILDAETVKIVAEGTIDTRSGALAANVLAAPLQTANWLVDKIPLVRRIFGGTVLAIPAQVIGTVKNPVVLPLGPRAVGSRATQLLANTLRLPVDVLKMLEPKTAPPGSAGAGADVRPP